MSDLIWCDICEMHNCADHTTNVGARFDASIKESGAERGSAMFMGDGVQIAAQFPGFCGGCGRAFDAQTLIRRDPDHDGWRTECCW